MRPLKVTLNKLAVAKRQIDTAIWLWFNDGDVVSIVSLTGAALGVLDGLYQKAKKGRPFPFDEKTIPKRRKRAGRFHSTKRPFLQDSRREMRVTSLKRLKSFPNMPEAMLTRRSTTDSTRLRRISIAPFPLITILRENIKSQSFNLFFGRATALCIR